MAANSLKLDDDETELLLIGHPKRLAKATGFELLLGDVKVKTPPCAWTLGVYFDSSLSLKLYTKC